MNEASFTVDVSADDALKFAELSGDWNPLHTDPKYASKTTYKIPVLHGAFSAGLISRLAGMHLPGVNSLLYSINLRFLKPIIPPVSLLVTGVLNYRGGGSKQVNVSISDNKSGSRYVKGFYEFGYHEVDKHLPPKVSSPNVNKPVVLITGASGGIGSAILSLLGDRAIGVSRQISSQTTVISDLEKIKAELPDCQLDGIAHCAWELPDNLRFVDLNQPIQSIETHIASPLRQIQALAKLLKERGRSGATLILFGSTFALPGRHNYRGPLYSLAKSMVPTLVRILAIELATKKMRCIGLVFDIIDGGMNKIGRASCRERV